tara:strand:+ start:787 stop:1548 length:762 start_codon:yes stop_codon:yes gene_type:complete
MNVLLITQNEPFYLRTNLEYLIKIFPKDCKIVGCVLSKPSPFGKKNTFVEKVITTFKIFGIRFFIFYSVKYLLSKIFKKSIKSLLKENDISLIELNKSINSPNSIDVIKKYNPDLLVSILGNQIFKSQLINLAPKGCINLHTALLPKYRGLMPSFWVLKNNERYTGVSVFFVDEGIDSGPIIVQEKIEIKNRSQAELIKYSKKIGMECVAEAVNLIKKDSVVLISNPDSEKTYFSFPKREDVLEFLKNGKSFF